MKLSECKIGVVVSQKQNDLWYITKKTDEPSMVGHIVGLSTNGSGEVIPVVRFVNYLEYNSILKTEVYVSKEIAIHHFHLELYND